MFWGKGDVSKLTPEARALKAQLEELENAGFIVSLRPEQTDMAMQALRFYAAIVATTGILAGARNTCLWLAGMVTMYWAFKDTIVQFIRLHAGTP